MTERAVSRTIDAGIVQGGMVLAGLRVFLAGGVRLELGERVLDEMALGGRQPRLAFAMLVMERRRAVPREELAEAIWPEGLPRTWEPALRGVVSKVRTFLGTAGLPADESITSSFGCYQLRLPPDAAVDIELDGLIAEAETALRSEDCTTARTLLNAIVYVTRQPFLAGSEGIWVDGVRRAIHNQRARALRLSAEAALLEEDPEAAIAAADELLLIEPFQEDAHRLCMRAHAVAGNRAQALWAYERCRSLLAEELGTDPSSETQALHVELLSAVPLDGSAPVPPFTWTPPPELDARRAPPIVDREAELGILDDALTRAKSGRTTVAIVRGAAGVGKTRLVAELAADAITSGVVVIGGDAGSGAHPLAPLADCMRWALGGLPDLELDGLDDRDLDALAALVGDVWHPSLTGREGNGADPRRAIGRLLRSVSDRRAVLLVIDDAQRAEAQLVDAVRFLTETFTDLRMLVVLIHRGERRVLERLQSVPDLVEVVLGPFDGEVIRSLLPAADADALDAAERALLAESRGMPAHVLDVIRTLPTVDDRLPLPERIRAAAVKACPYKGLLTYEPEDAYLFVGREDGVAEVLDRLETQPFVVVVGPSGCGKSSMVRAGVVPVLEHKGLNVRVMAPGQDPDGALDRALTDVGGPVALVVDQFEELFTLSGDPQSRRGFCDRLVSFVEIGSPVIVTMRGDVYGHLTEHPELAALAERGTILLGTLANLDLRRIVLEPARRAGYTVQPGLAELVTTDIGQDPGGLPLLSHVMLETWRRRRGQMLTIDAYHAVGGTSGAIARSGEAAYLSLDPGAQTVARALLLRLTEPGERTDDSRRSVPVAELLDLTGTDRRNTERVLDALVQARLVTVVGDGTATLSHEALIRNWPRLRRWLDEDRESLRTERHLATAAAEWDRLGRPTTELYRGQRLVAVQDWIAGQAPNLTTAQRTFVHESTSVADVEAERERRARRRLRRLLAAAVVGSVIAASAASFAAVQRNNARSQAEFAQVQRLAAEAAALAKESPPLALNLAAEAFRRRPDLVETRSALLSALMAEPTLLGFLGDAREATAVAGSGGGLAAFPTDDGIAVWDVEKLRPVRTIPIRGQTLTRRTLAFAPDDRLVVMRKDGTVEQWDARAGRRLGDPFTVGLEDAVIDVDERGTRALVTNGSRVSIVDLRAGQVAAGPVSIEAGAGRERPQSTAALSGDGRTVAVPIGGSPPALATWSTDNLKPTGDPIPLPGIGDCCIQHVDVDRAGRTAVVAHLTAPDSPPVLVDLTDRRTFTPLRAAAESTSAVFAQLGNDEVLVVGSDRSKKVFAASSLEVRAEWPTGVPRADIAIAGDVLVVGGSPPTAWSLDGRSPLWKTPRRHGEVAWEFSDEGRLVTGAKYGSTGPASNTLSVFERASGNVIRSFKGDAWPISDELIRWTDPKGVLRIVDHAGKVVRPPFDLGAPTNVGSWDAQDPQARWVAWGRFPANFNGAHVNDLRTGRRLFDVEMRSRGSTATRGGWFSPQGDLLSVTGWGRLVVVSVPDGKRLFDIAEPAQYATFAGDGRTIAVARPNDVVVRDSRTGKALGRPFRDVGGFVGWAELNRNGRLLAISSEKSVQLFDVPSGSRLGPALPVPANSFGLFGGEVMVFTTPKGIVDLDLDPAKWADAACRVAGSNFSKAEWRRYLPLDRDYRPTCPGLPTRS